MQTELSAQTISNHFALSIRGLEMGIKSLLDFFLYSSVDFMRMPVARV